MRKDHTQNFKRMSLKASPSPASNKLFYKIFTPFAHIIFSEAGLKTYQKLVYFIKKYSVFILCFFLAFFISDLLLIKSYSSVLPEKTLPPLRLKPQVHSFTKDLDKHKTLWENNIFHTGAIPLVLKAKVQDLSPVLSELSFHLKGTIIHSNPKKSVATIQSGYSNKASSYQVGDSIDNQAQVKEIKRGRVIFFNENNSRLEYILLPEDTKNVQLSYEEERPKTRTQKDSLVKKRGENQYRVSRSDINQQLKNLPEILNQARVVPHREGGELKGFRFQSIQEGSVYESLGFQVGDIIKEVDGEFVKDPEQALELFERLKGSSGFKILVEKQGKEVELDYSVNENAPIL